MGIAKVSNGRLDALSGVSGYIRNGRAEYVILADCDLIANLDFQSMIAFHEEKEAEITLAYRREKIRREGNENIVVFDAEDDGRVGRVWLSPQMEEEQNVYLNVAVMKRELLEKIVEEARSRNKRSFTKDILIEQSDSMRIYAYEIEKYVMRINSLQDYFDASMALLHPQVRQELFPCGTAGSNAGTGSSTCKIRARCHCKKFAGGGWLHYRGNCRKFDYFPRRKDWPRRCDPRQYYYGGRGHRSRCEAGICSSRTGMRRFEIPECW